MKNVLYRASALLMIFTALALNSCVDPVDLVTENAQEGGLIDVLSQSLPFKAGTNPTLEIAFDVPVGPGIQSVEVTKVFTTVDGDVSNTVVLETIDIANSNTSDIVSKNFTVVYDDLIEGLTVNGSPLPADEKDNEIGDAWTLHYYSIMSDGRRVANNQITNIGVANPYAGKYSRVGLLIHPTAGNLPYDETGLDLKTVDASTVKTLVGYWENPNYSLVITVNPDFTCSITGDVGGTEVTAIPGKDNKYDPATKKFTLNYTYNGRLFNEVMTAE